MRNSWTAERNVQLLLLIIKFQGQGSPDYNFIGAQLGVTASAASQQFGILRKNFALPQSGPVEEVQPKPRAKRNSKVKDESAADDGVKRRKKPRRGQMEANSNGNAERLEEIKVESEGMSE